MWISPPKIPQSITKEPILDWDQGRILWGSTAVPSEQAGSRLWEDPSGKKWVWTELKGRAVAGWGKDLSTCNESLILSQIPREIWRVLSRGSRSSLHVTTFDFRRNGQQGEKSRAGMREECSAQRRSGGRLPGLPVWFPSETHLSSWPRPFPFPWLTSSCSPHSLYYTHMEQPSELNRYHSLLLQAPDHCAPILKHFPVISGQLLFNLQCAAKAHKVLAPGYCRVPWPPQLPPALWPNSMMAHITRGGLCLFHILVFFFFFY